MSVLRELIYIMAKTSDFVGRKEELARLHMLSDQNRSAIAVIKGRRRIGKSRLASEYAKIRGCRLLTFSGLAPSQEINLQQQIDHFAAQLCLQVGIPRITFNDWYDAFNCISHHLSGQPTIILFDEISWLADKDPAFISKLKNWWDLNLSLRGNVMLILCGSVSTWIEENIISSTALFGRISLIVTLQPFSLTESLEYLRKRGYKGSIYDVYKILCITGGVPWYLEQISVHSMALQNIQQLCFTPGGVLVDEYNRIVNDLFDKKGVVYQKILEALKDGSKNLHEIRQIINYGNSGTISMYMEHLITSGFVRKYKQWNIKTGKASKQSLYSLSDPYIRFYLKYMLPIIDQIKGGRYKDIDINSLPGFEIILALQIECLLLQNRELILRALNIAPYDCMHDNPYIQKANSRAKGCQIDYLIQTRNKNLFVCEFKFKTREINTDIILEMQDKLERFQTARQQAAVPVLFHIGGVVNSVYEKNYFFRIIDLADLIDTSRMRESHTQHYVVNAQD
jgi:AAA+ ATPase superfamily predicted ATPase